MKKVSRIVKRMKRFKIGLTIKASNFDNLVTEGLRNKVNIKVKKNVKYNLKRNFQKKNNQEI